MRRWLLNDRPIGRPVRDEDFKLVELPIPQPRDGEVLLKNHYIGLNPAQKGWMENVADYSAPMALGDPMRGYIVGEVIETRNPEYKLGDMLAGYGHWEEYSTTDGDGLELSPGGVPASAMLSVLGINGMAAFGGLFKVGKPVPGDTVVVSGAAGATGSIVCQLAKVAGCRVIGIAGGTRKCQWLVDEVGCDAAIDYKAEDVRRRLKALCPHGVDVIFDNVGGAILNEMLALIADRARTVICGGIARYEAADLPPGPQRYFNLVFRRATMEGFIVWDWKAEYPEMRRRLIDLLQSGRIKYLEDVQYGIENTPAAFKRLFDGSNFGKQLVKL
ncbi:MAG: NADP-dependent oxidoreductase [Sphingomonadaceae bacterium]|nr:NADP-dependent oxidoreductase [Sphingomonadaceae bacterium]